MAVVRTLGAWVVGALTWVGVGLCGVSSALGATPVFTPVPGSPFFSTLATSTSVAFSPSGGLLAVTNYGGNSTVSVFSVNSSTGALTPVPGSPFATGIEPFSAAFSPSGELLAVTNVAAGAKLGTVSVFSVSSDGTLTQVAGSPFATGYDPFSVAFSPSGGLLAVANGTDNTVSVFSVNSAGALTPVPRSPFAAGADPRSLAFSPSGGLLAVANLSGKTVSVFSVNSAGALTPVPASPFAAASYAGSVAFSPSGGLLAVGAGGVSVFSVNSDGMLTPVPGSPFASAGGPVAFSPSGELLAADSTGSSVSVLSVSSDGTLTQVPGSPFAETSFPGSVAFSPSGELLAFPDYGRVSVFSISYTNAAAPSVHITSPSNAATYTQGQLVEASFGCLEGVGGPGLGSCAGTVPNGTPIDTTTLGRHTFTVTATSNSGLNATSTINYTVQPQITVSHIEAKADGTTTFQVNVPGPGVIDVLETAWNDNLAVPQHPERRQFVLLQPAPDRFVFARSHISTTSAGTLSVTTDPAARGASLIRHHRYRVTLRLWVTYTPTGGSLSSVGFYGLHLGSGCPDAASSGQRTKIECAVS